jgi:hypothetical protein
LVRSLDSSNTQDTDQQHAARREVAIK